MCQLFQSRHLPLYKLASLTIVSSHFPWIPSSSTLQNLVVLCNWSLIRILLIVEQIMEVEMSLADSLMKVLMFVIVQALVYLILSKSSDIFSKNKMRSLSFKPARSLSIRRILASISDLPQGVEPSPSSRSLRSSTQEYPEEHETY